MKDILTSPPHLDADEVGAALRSHSLGHQRLAAARRPVQQHAAGCAEAHGSKGLRVRDGLADGERQLLTHLTGRQEGKQTVRQASKAGRK